MDGLPALPALSTAPAAQTFPPQIPGAAPRPAAAPAPVGRPSNDPAEQERRAIRSQEHQRLAGLTPPRAKDSKLYLFEVTNGRPSRKPVATLLASQIEEEIKGLSGMPEDERLDEAVSRLLPDEIDNCRLSCQWYSKDGRPIPDTSTWDMDLGNPADGQGDEDLPEDGPFAEPIEPISSSFPTSQVMPSAAPPAPPVLDMAAIARSFREERTDERRNSEGTFQALMAMQQSSQNMQIQMAAQARQDALAAEERAEKRRAEFRQNLVTVVLPLVLPMIQNLFGPKGMSPETMALIEVLKGNASKPDSAQTMMEGMIRMQGELTAQTLKLQAEGAGISAQMNAQATKLIFEQLMGTLKETMALKTQAPEEKEQSVWGQIAEVAAPLLAGLTGQQPPAGQQPQLDPATPVQQAPRRPVPKIAPPPPPPAPTGQAAPAEQAPPPPPARPKRPPIESFPDIKRIQQALLGVRLMSLGQWAPERHWDAVNMVIRWMPEALRAAVKAQDEQQVMTLATEAALKEPTVIQWITDEANAAFLRRTLVDVRLLLLVNGNLQNLTEEQIQGGIAEHRKTVESRRQATQLATAAQAQAQLRHNNPPLPGETQQQAPPVEATVVGDPAGMVANPTSAAVPEATVVQPPPAANQ